MSVESMHNQAPMPPVQDEAITTGQMALFEQDLAAQSTPAAEFAAPAATAEEEYVAPESNTRATVRIADRVADLADRASVFAGNFADKWAARRTTRELARDKKDAAKEYAGAKVERGKEVARTVGQTIVVNAGAAEFVAKTSVRNGYNTVKENGQEKAGNFKNFLRQKAESARSHKDSLVANLKERRDNALAAGRRGFETSVDRSKRAAKVGGEILKVTGFAVVGTGVIAGEAAVKGVKIGAEKTSDAAKLAAEKARSSAHAVKVGAVVVGQGIKQDVNTARAEFADSRANHFDKREARKANAVARKEAARQRHADRATARREKAANLRG